DAARNEINEAIAAVRQAENELDRATNQLERARAKLSQAEGKLKQADGGPAPAAPDRQRIQGWWRVEKVTGGQDVAEYPHYVFRGDTLSFENPGQAAEEPRIT